MGGGLFHRRWFLNASEKSKRPPDGFLGFDRRSGVRPKRVMPILYADGSVRRVEDLNGDGLINPGSEFERESQTGYNVGPAELNGTTLVQPQTIERRPAKGLFE